MAMTAADLSSGWVEAIRQRRKALLQRLGMGAASALVFSPILGWDFSALWVAGYFLVQVLDLWVFGPVNGGRARSLGPARFVAAAVMLVLNAAYFGSLSVPLWLVGGPMGGVCAAILLSSGAIYAVVNAPRSRTVLALSIAPQFLYLAVTPVFMMIFGASAAFATAVAIAIAVFMTYCLSTWQRMDTARKSEEAARLDAERRRVEAERVMESRQAFLAAVGHDLRTPISAILAGAGVLQDGATDRTARNQAQLITDAGLMMKSLLDDLLDHAKIEAGGMTVEVNDFNLRSLIAQTARLWQGPIASKGLRLRIEGAAQVPSHVRGDAMRLRQVLNNLISNAVKFTDSGSITLKLSVWDEEPSGHAVLIEVRDTGPGMTPAQITRLFQPFDQTTEGVSARHGGTGLGLAISRHLTELMGGRLTARSQPGAGSSFTVAVSFPRALSDSQDLPTLDRAGREVVARALGGLPAPAPAAPKPREEARVEPSSVHAERVEADAVPDIDAVETVDAAGVDVEEDDAPMRVLVVDDHDINRRAIQLILQPLGCDVTTAADGMAALKACDAQSFDLIFMDVRMPELDGRETTRRLRASDNANAQVPVIAVTADTSPDDITACADAGMTYFVPKPITPATLLGAVNHVMNGETIQGSASDRVEAVA
ncbi:ATP-binding protein [Brevundimonas halotolerans]|uniref:histidine kinase n=2 Tax=Brevundimonas halotolerans TaxID=69670 RepID=A0A7W9A4S7_9CAUL|nr:ATP-binding protein [Brevundimonas halotolerans]MBB5661232.1 signal transduction histidine kinase/CheY-like chemotaxis protein [Brevundimonas halotolerans]